MYFEEHSAKLKLKIKFKKIFVVSPKKGNIFFDLVKGILSFYVSDLRPSKGQYKNAKNSLGVRIESNLRGKGKCCRSCFY